MVGIIKAGLILILLICFTFDANAIIRRAGPGDGWDFRSNGNNSRMEIKSDGTVEVKGRFEATSAANASRPCPSLTTGERGSLTPAKADCIYNETDNKLNFFDTVWREILDSDSTQTLTNKTYNADLNNLSNVQDSNIKTGAAIARSKLANGTANYVLINDGSGVTSEEQFLDKTRGGTGITSTATFPASGTIVTEDAAQTLTNKTVDADNGTYSNFNHGSEVDNPSSGVHGVTGSVVGTSDSQTLTNKTIAGGSNTISGLTHGSEVDNPSSGVHGVTGSVVGTTDSQTLTNKDYDGGTASNSLRFTFPKNTKANLDGLTRKEGTCAWASDEDKFYCDDGATLSEVGGGGSALEVEDEGVSLTVGATKFNFVGELVTVTEPVADEMLVTISAGGGGTPTLVDGSCTSALLDGWPGGTTVNTDQTWTISGGKCVAPDATDFIRYDLPSTIALGQSGAIHLDFKALYSGNPPSGETYFIWIEESGGSLGPNTLRVAHQNDGDIQVVGVDSSGTIMINDQSIGTWNPTAGQTYNFKLEWDFDDFGVKVYIDDVLLGTLPQSGGTTRTDNIQDIAIVGRETSGPMISEEFDNVKIYEQPVVGEVVSPPLFGVPTSVEDEGIELTDDVKKINFVGTGVTVTEPVDDEVEVEINASTGADCGFLKGCQFEIQAETAVNGLDCIAGVCSLDVTNNYMGKGSLLITTTATTIDADHCYSNANLQANGQMVEASAKIKTSIVGAKFCATDGTSDLQCVDISSADSWDTYKVFGQIPNSGTPEVCYKITAPSSTDTLQLDNGFAGEFKADGTTKKLKQEFRYHALAGWGSVNNKVPYFTNVDVSGDDIGDFTNDSTNGFLVGTKYNNTKIDMECGFSYGTTAGRIVGITRNSTQLTTQIQSVNSEDVLSTTQSQGLNTSDSVTIGSDTVINVGGYVNPHIESQSLAAGIGFWRCAGTLETEIQATVLSKPGFDAAQIKWRNVSGCRPSATSGSYGDMSDGQCSFASATTIGNVLTPSFAGEIALKLPLLPPGKYEVSYSGAMLATNPNDTTCGFRIYDTTNSKEIAASLSYSGTGQYEYTNHMSGIVEYNSETTNAEFKIQAKRDSGTGTCDLLGDGTNANITLNIKPISQTIVGTFKAAVRASKVSGVSAVLAGTGGNHYYGFPTTDYDFDGNFNTPITNGWTSTIGNSSAYTVPSDGLYKIAFASCVNLTSLSDSNTVSAFLNINGATSNFKRGTFEGGGGTSHQFDLMLTTTLNLLKDDVLRFGGNQDSGANSSNCSLLQTWATVEKVDQAGVLNNGAPENEFVDSSVSSNEFTGGGITIFKHGRQVTLRIDDAITHASGNTIDSAVGYIPSWARPPEDINQIYTSDASFVYKATIRADGQIRFVYRDWAGAASNRVNSGGKFSYTYLVD